MFSCWTVTANRINVVKMWNLLFFGEKDRASACFTVYCRFYSKTIAEEELQTRNGIMNRGDSNLAYFLARILTHIFW